MKKLEKRTIVRNSNLARDIIIVDGLPGCGKSMISSIIASFERVEILSYVFEIEFICRLFYMGKITEDASIAMINNLIDQKLYNCMMGRDVNFRYTDLSGIFSNPYPIKYLKRIFQEGDLVVPERISKLKPILNLATHDLLSMSRPLQKALVNRITFIEVVRHPLFMLIQQYYNLERLLFNPRDIQIHFEYKNQQLPYFAYGWEDLFLQSNNIDRTIFSMENQIKLTQNFKKRTKYNLITIPFEIFVKSPDQYIKKIESFAKTRRTKVTNKVMRKQKVPRKNIVDGLSLDIYKRCGWTPPTSGLSEDEEFLLRRKFAVDKGASQQAISKLDQISKNYEDNFLS